MTDLARYLEDLNERYLELHHHKESAFWETRMGLADRQDELGAADVALREFIGDSERLAELRRLREEGGTGEENVVLDGWILMFERNQVEDPEARAMLRGIVEKEGSLQKARGEMKLGYEGAEGFVAASSVALSNAVRTNPDASIRRAAFAGLRSIEDFALANGWIDIVKQRNHFARKLGYEDFYDYKVQWAEGFDKKTLFGFLDELEARTRDKAQSEIDRLRAEHGDDAIEPWNFGYLTWGGSIQADRDPYFRFEDALERWARSFDAMGIRFRGAKITLDLVDRKGKYENGFMHGPVPAFVRRGEFLPAEINFTANALPGQVGSGHRAIQTLFHEGGHAAHFANIVMGAPCFSQEFAPTSVAFAETQSMFCDSVLSDADWQTRYARGERGEPIPFALIEKDIRATHPFFAQTIRNMLVVCYAEKAVYELPDDELTPPRVLEIFRDVEARISLLPGGNPRPTLAVPHLLSWEASAYYHGYVLAQMAVYQTRAHFMRKYGTLLDEPRIGEDLAATYWRPGNSKSFLDLVREMTGSPFSADAIVEEASLSTEEAVRRARERVEAMPEPGAREEPDLDLRLSVIHGAEVVVPEGTAPLDAAGAFRAWILERWPTADATV
jgi:oligoendopeptidase F